MTYPPQGGSQQEQPGGPYGQPGQPYGQAPYGQSPYWAPYGQSPYWAPYGQPKESKTGLIVGLVVLAVVLIAGAVGLTLALSSTVLDPADTAGQVAQQFQQREGVAIDLSCPDDMKVSNGSTYECTGTTADGEDVTLTISITDEDAKPPTYTWSEA